VRWRGARSGRRHGLTRGRLGQVLEEILAQRGLSGATSDLLGSPRLDNSVVSSGAASGGGSSLDGVLSAAKPTFGF
jgi:hypothetical protein